MANEIDEAEVAEFLRRRGVVGATPSVTAPAPLTAEAQRGVRSSAAPEELEILAPGIGGRSAPAALEEGLESSGLPGPPLRRSAAGQSTPAGMREQALQALELKKSNFRAAQQAPESRPFTDAAIRGGANMAATGAAGLALGPGGLAAGIGMRTVAQGATALLTEFGVRRAQGDDFKTALVNALEVGGLDAVLEAGAGVPGQAVKLAKPLVRAGIDKAGRAIRKATDLPLPTRKVRAESLRAPVAHTLEPGAREVIAETERLANKEGISAPFTPGQLVDHSIVDTLENLAADSAPAGAKIRKARQEPLRLNRQAVDELVASMPHATSEELLVIFRDLGEDRLKELTGLAGGMFDTLDEALGKEAVNIGPFKEALEKKLSGHAGGLLPEAFNKVKQILDMPDTITYGRAQQIRTDLHTISKQFGGEAVLKAEQGLAKWSAGQFKNVLTRAISQLAPELLPIAKEANRLWGQEVRGELTNSYIKRMANQSPETVVDAIIKGNQPAFVRLVRNIVKDQDPSGEAWEKVQGAWFKSIMWDATEAATSGPLDELGKRSVKGSKILELAKTRASADDPMLRAMFPGREGQKLVNQFLLNARGMAFAERAAGGSGTGTIWFAMKTAGAFGVVAGIPGDLLLNGNVGFGSGIVGTSIAILMAPRVIANVLKSPTGSKWLSVGLKKPQGSRAGRRALLGLTGYMLREKLLPPEEEVKAKELLTATREALRQDKRDRPSNRPDFSRELAGASPTAIP